MRNLKIRQHILLKCWFFRVGELENKAAGSFRILVPIYQIIPWQMAAI
jgi:hypothetical protein